MSSIARCDGREIGSGKRASTSKAQRACKSKREKKERRKERNAKRGERATELIEAKKNSNEREEEDFCFHGEKKAIGRRTSTFDRDQRKKKERQIDRASAKK